MIEHQQGIVPTLDKDGSSYWHDPELQMVADSKKLSVSCYVVDRDKRRSIQIRDRNGLLWQVSNRKDAITALDLEEKMANEGIARSDRVIDRLIVAGGRDYSFDASDIAWLASLGSVKEVVCGGAKGADMEGLVLAKKSGIPVKMFHADWELHGKAAGPIRNREMAKYATVLALFPGGRGSESMKREAEKAGIDIYESPKRAKP
jgi:hypothetical protein|tara:strand:- start:2187 stop:2798 length:612 start_codon:yes stop_codon:yes gene_type:complete